MSDFSSFERQVLLCIINGNSEETSLEGQIESAGVVSREYSGAGSFINICVSNSHPRLRTSKNRIEQATQVHLEHPELEAGAGAILWLEDGLISQLELYSYSSIWPADEANFTVATSKSNHTNTSTGDT